MTEYSRAWQGTTTGDAGAYSSNQWAQLWRYGVGVAASKADASAIIGSGTSPDIGLTVQAATPASANVLLTVGSALVNGTFYLNDANKTLAVSANASGNTRIDTVILRKDWTAQTVRALIKQGTPAASPVPPTLTQTDNSIWEVPIADIEVASGFTSITNANITPRRLFANASDGVYLLDVYNNSGAVLETGDVVVWSSAGDRYVTTTTTARDPDVAGVVIGRIAAGAYGRVLSRGIGFVRTTAAIASRLTRLYTSTTAKRAFETLATATSTYGHHFATSLTTTSAAGLCLAYVNVPSTYRGAYSQVKTYPDGATTTTSTAFATAGSYTATLTMRSGIVEVVYNGNVTCDDNTVTVYGDIDVDGTRYSNVANGAFIILGDKGFTFLIAGLSAGAHTISLKWRLSGLGLGAPTATMQYASFTAREVW